MTEHWIRLRGGWEWPDRPDLTVPARVTLPLRSPPGAPGRVRLVRRFQAPSIAAATQSVWLRLDAVPGLVSVILNGHEVVPTPPPDAGLLVLPTGQLRASGNQLEVIADLAPTPEGDLATPWGEIALVVRDVPTALENLP